MDKWMLDEQFWVFRPEEELYVVSSYSWEVIRVLNGDCPKKDCGSDKLKTVLHFVLLQKHPFP